MKTKTLMTGLLLLAVALAPLAIAAPENGPGRQGQRGPRGGGFGGPGAVAPQGRMQQPGGLGGGNLDRMLLGRLGEQLELTAEQKAQIKTIAEANQEKNETTGKAVQEAMQTLRKATDEGAVEDIKAAGKAAGEALTEQALQRATVTRQIKGVLTEEQLAKLKELQAQMRERGQQRIQQRRDQQGQGQGPGPMGPRGGRGGRQRPDGMGNETD